jgi:ABC-type multidrug transport system fused ATPase/permease subunit
LGTGALTTKLANETRMVDVGFGNSIARQLQVACTLCISLIIGFSASWQIALVVIATLPLNILAATISAAVASGQQ